MVASARAGGWAVQLAAMSSQGDANALRDKLRANGFDGFVDTVQASGKQLWRVRAGPQTQRDDAVRMREQIKAKLGIDGNIVPVP
jgi:cell division septation protein DedD